VALGESRWRRKARVFKMICKFERRYFSLGDSVTGYTHVRCSPAGMGFTFLLLYKRLGRNVKPTRFLTYSTVPNTRYYHMGYISRLLAFAPAINVGLAQYTVGEKVGLVQAQTRRPCEKRGHLCRVAEYGGMALLTEELRTLQLTVCAGKEGLIRCRYRIVRTTIVKMNLWNSPTGHSSITVGSNLVSVT
jgi:hypothetical protein